MKTSTTDTSRALRSVLMGSHRTVERAGFGAVLRNRLFAVLFVAETQSIVGDQLARVALSVLVFDQTSSEAATGLTYAATYMPAIVGGLLFARLGDLLPRRLTMVGCDVLRAALFAAMSIAGLPIGGVIALLVVAVLIGPVFTASEVAYLSASLDAEEFRTGNGLRVIAGQAAQIGGFAVGGVLVTQFGARPTLLIDGATFLLSALAVLVLPATPARRAADRHPDVVGKPVGAKRTGSWPFGDPGGRVLVVMCALAGFFVVPEGLAVPFGESVGASTTEVGLLLAAIPAGSAIGAALTVRLVARHRRAQVGRWMAFAAGSPLLLTATVDSWTVAALCWLTSGILTGYLVDATSTIISRTPPERTSQVVGAMNSVLLGAQGVGLALFGLVASVADPGLSIAFAGGAAMLLAAVLVLRPRSGASSTHRNIL